MRYSTAINSRPKPLMRSRLKFLAIAALTWFSQTAALAEDFSVTLSPQSQTVHVGETPHFQITTKAGSVALRIMNFSARPDLRDNYAKIHVTEHGQEVSVPRAISDPGPVSDADFLTLLPGQITKFQHDGSPYDLQSLGPGEYTAVVTLWPDWRGQPLKSNAVTFRVVRK
jgi:hypothetical protein